MIGAIIFTTLGVVFLWWAAGCLTSGDILWAVVQGAASYWFMRLGWNIAMGVYNDKETDERA
jgi:hypothetical protein